MSILAHGMDSETVVFRSKIRGWANTRVSCLSRKRHGCTDTIEVISRMCLGFDLSLLLGAYLL